jgi:REP element-mobilizing transposase RayT
MHSYCSNLLHVVFSTKERRRAIVPEIRDRLWAFMGGTARELGMSALIVGGVDDHAHLLLSLPPTIAIAEAVKKLKANSCRWLHENFPQRRSFQWQKGYGAFSVGISQVNETIAYGGPRRARFWLVGVGSRDRRSTIAGSISEKNSRRS